MNGTTLKALRLALGFSQQEAANLIGQVQLRTWQYWEDADRRIPEDVVATLRDLGRFKQKLVAETAAQIERLTSQHGAPESIRLTYYTNLDDWMTQDGAEPLLWRPHCMAMANLAERFPVVELVRFDAVAYQHWLAGRPDNSALRGEWAARV